MADEEEWELDPLQPNYDLRVGFYYPQAEVYEGVQNGIVHFLHILELGEQRYHPRIGYYFPMPIVLRNRSRG